MLRGIHEIGRILILTNQQQNSGPENTIVRCNIIQTHSSEHIMLSQHLFHSLHFTVVFKHRNKNWDLHYVLNVPQTGYTWGHVKTEERRRKSRAGFILKRPLKHQAFQMCKYSFSLHSCTYRASQRSWSKLSNKLWTTAGPYRRLAVVRPTDQ